MRRTLFSILVLLLTIAAEAQTLKITTGSNTYSFSAEEMTESSPATFSNGSTVTINGTTINLSDITSVTVGDESSSSTDVDANTVNIVYNGSSATVTAASNVAAYVSASVSGAHVTITQSNTDAVDGDEITYVLSGSTTDGSQKACIYSKGQLQLQGNGTLNVVGKLKHGIKSASYIQIKNLVLNITSAVGDGINCEEYFLMKSGTVNISGTQDDGIQCDLGSTTSTGETTDHEDEDTGNIYLEGGTLSVTVTAAASKGIKAAGDMRISSGDITVKTTGNGAYDSDERDAKGCAGLKSDGNMTIGGGTITLTSTGTGGKCIKADGTLTINDGTVKATSSGSQYRYSSSATASPKAIKADGGMVVNGGSVYAKSSSHEGIESKGTLTITGGNVYAESSDDAVNSAGDMTISGGYVMANSSGNDGLDANGNCYIKGGNVFAVATSQPEVGIDANTEQRKQLYITGGNVVAIGGFENGSSISGGTAMQYSSYSKGTWYGLYNGSDVAFAFKVPSNSKMGNSMAVYTTGTPTLKSGVTSSGESFWNGYGQSNCSGGSNVTLSNYSSGGNRPGGWH